MRKAIFLAAATVASMAAMTSTAGATEVVYNGITHQPCPNVTLSGNTVSGGCLVEDMAGGWNMMAPYPSGPKVVTGCNTSFDFRTSAYSTIYAINQQNSCSGLQRRPCTDNSTGAKIPWPSWPVSVSGVLLQKINMCVENPNDPSYDAWQEVTFRPIWHDKLFRDPFLGFVQEGSSQNGYIAGAQFHQADPYAYGKIYRAEL